MDIVLFGVGQYTDKFINIIHYFGKTVSYLADNDKKKAGETFHGIKVISPELLIGLDCKIIVSCIHWKEIGGAQKTGISCWQRSWQLKEAG